MHQDRPPLSDAGPRLAAERQDAVRRVAQLRAEHDELADSARDSNADDEHDPEGTTLAFERSQLRTVLRQAERHLTQVDEAMARLEAGTWGICEVCGESIAPERLEARPAAVRCVGCA